MPHDDSKKKNDHPNNKVKFGHGKGNFGICVRLVFLCIGLAGFCCSLAALGKCDFFLYEPRFPPPGVEDTRPPTLENITSATLGLFKYDFDSEGCRDIPEDFDQLSGWFKAAQVGACLAVFLSAAALALILVDLVCCRFPCSRLLISTFFLVAVFCQALTFLVYAAPICDPNYVNGPFPCSADMGTWISVAASGLFLIAGCLTCCVPKPIPVAVRVLKCLEDDETDGCCAICWRHPKDKEGDDEVQEAAPDEEKGTVVAAGGAIVPSGEEEPVEPKAAEELEADHTQAAIAVDLVAVRRGKQDEIEKQLELLTKYKDHLSEEEYDEKVTKLIHALPNPETYDIFTKTETILPVQGESSDEEEGGEEDDDELGEGVEVEEDEQKKSLGTKITESAGTVGSTMGSAMKGVKNTVTGGSSKETPK